MGDGNVSCMSSNGKDCWWGRCRGTKVPPHPKNIDKTSLVCGAHHKKMWGSTGYGNGKEHWCNKAQKYCVEDEERYESDSDDDDEDEDENTEVDVPAKVIKQVIKRSPAPVQRRLFRLY